MYLTNGASLSGFTLTNGFADSGGGVYCESATAVLSNCVLSCNSASSLGGGAYSGTLNNCTLTGNSAGYGGGAYRGTLNNCAAVGNSAFYYGGGAYASTLNNCTVVSNSATVGGGAYGEVGGFPCTLNNCTLTGNSATSGGGAETCTLNNCTLTGNSASDSGGGAFYCALYNCTLTCNGAANAGGGAYASTLNNCTVVSNSATVGGGAYGEVGGFPCTLNNCTLTGNSATSGGGAETCTLNNCIVYFNTAAVGANYDASSTLSYCCTTPQPVGGTNNLSLDPQLASASHLSAGSPCRGAGSAAYATGTDIDGEAWGVPPSIGCDEYHAGSVTGLLSVAISAAYTNVAAGFPVGLTALIEGRTSASLWDFGDGIAVSNRPYASHAWAAAGDYVLVLWAYNESLPAGVSSTVTIHVVAQPVYYVAADSTNPSPPYGSWATAATNIQDAVDAATVAGAWVLVTNGTYVSGERVVEGTITNRVAVDKPIVLRSINGPQFTVINGQGGVRCVYLRARASLSGFTLTNGVANSGGGVWCESDTGVISNCVLVANSASDGGGAYGGALYNCTLTGNSGDGASMSTLYNCRLTGNSGGGASGGTLYNCALTDNSGVGASGATLYNCTLTCNSAGGAVGSTLYNCIVYYNTAGVGANYDSSIP